jgi:hypothetical protein
MQRCIAGELGFDGHSAIFASLVGFLVQMIEIRNNGGGLTARCYTNT